MEEYAPYSLDDFREFYKKVCTKLTLQESEFLYKLSKSSETDLASHSNFIGFMGTHWHPKLTRPFDAEKVREAKKNYLQGLLAGSSLDYLEIVSDEFYLAFADSVKLGNDNLILFLSQIKKNGELRSLGEILEIAKQYGTDDAHSASFISHHVDRNDYMLVGKRIADDEYKRRLHEWRLDENFDGDW